MSEPIDNATWSEVLLQASKECTNDRDRVLYVHGIMSTRCITCHCQLKSLDVKCDTCNQKTRNTEVCSHCHKSSIQRKAELWCYECDAYFCQFCYNKPHVLSLSGSVPPKHNCFAIDVSKGSSISKSSWSPAFQDLVKTRREKVIQALQEKYDEKKVQDHRNSPTTTTISTSDGNSTSDMQQMVDQVNESKSSSIPTVDQDQQQTTNQSDTISSRFSGSSEPKTIDIKPDIQVLNTNHTTSSVSNQVDERVHNAKISNPVNNATNANALAPNTQVSNSMPTNPKDIDSNVIQIIDIDDEPDDTSGSNIHRNDTKVSESLLSEAKSTKLDSNRKRKSQDISGSVLQHSHDENNLTLYEKVRRLHTARFAKKSSETKSTPGIIEAKSTTKVTSEQHDTYRSSNVERNENIIEQYSSSTKETDLVSNTEHSSQVAQTPTMNHGQSVQPSSAPIKTETNAQIKAEQNLAKSEQKIPAIKSPPPLRMTARRSAQPELWRSRVLEEMEVETIENISATITDTQPLKSSDTSTTLEDVKPTPPGSSSLPTDNRRASEEQTTSTTSYPNVTNIPHTTDLSSSGTIGSSLPTDTATNKNLQSGMDSEIEKSFEYAVGTLSDDTYEDPLKLAVLEIYDMTNTKVLELEKSLSTAYDSIRRLSAQNVTLAVKSNDNIRELQTKLQKAREERFTATGNVLEVSDNVLVQFRTIDNKLWSDVPHVLVTCHRKCSEIAAKLQQYRNTVIKLSRQIDEAVSSGKLDQVTEWGHQIQERKIAIEEGEKERDTQFTLMLQFSKQLRSIVLKTS